MLVEEYKLRHERPDRSCTRSAARPRASAHAPGGGGAGRGLPAAAALVGSVLARSLALFSSGKGARGRRHRA
jgi:hypothetical protein